MDGGFLMASWSPCTGNTMAGGRIRTRFSS